MDLAIFDLDHTLLPIDSDKAWNQFLIDTGAVDGNIIEKITNAFTKIT